MYMYGQVHVHVCTFSMGYMEYTALAYIIYHDLIKKAGFISFHCSSYQVVACVSVAGIQRGRSGKN